MFAVYNTRAGRFLSYDFEEFAELSKATAALFQNVEHAETALTEYLADFPEESGGERARHEYKVVNLETATIVKAYLQIPE